MNCCHCKNPGGVVILTDLHLIYTMFMFDLMNGCVLSGRNEAEGPILLKASKKQTNRTPHETLADNFASISNYLLPDSTSSIGIVESLARCSPKNPSLSSSLLSTCESISSALSGFTVSAACEYAADSSSSRK